MSVSGIICLFFVTCPCQAWRPQSRYQTLYSFPTQVPHTFARCLLFSWNPRLKACSAYMQCTSVRATMITCCYFVLSATAPARTMYRDVGDHVKMTILSTIFCERPLRQGLVFSLSVCLSRSFLACLLFCVLVPFVSLEHMDQRKRTLTVARKLVYVAITLTVARKLVYVAIRLTLDTSPRVASMLA
jgi:hypothetical protein